MSWFLGFDIGGTKCAVSLGKTQTDKNGEDALLLCAKEKFPTARQTPDRVLNAFLRCAEKLLEKEGLEFSDLSGIGISCGGPLDSKRGVILSPPNLPLWNNIEVVRFFEEKTGVPAFLQNDANACAVAEWKFGAGKGCDDLIFLTFGTGLGAGLILNGKLYSGVSDMAGEIGHVRLSEESDPFLPVGYGKQGSAEGYCSGGGLAQLGRHAAEEALKRGETPPLYLAAGKDLEKIDARLMAELAAQNDPMCRSLYEQCGRKLGRILSILVDLLNPSRVVIGGVFMRSEALLRPGMEAVLEEESLKYAREACTVAAAGLGEAVGDYAALSVAYAGAQEHQKQKGNNL